MQGYAAVRNFDYSVEKRNADKKQVGWRNNSGMGNAPNAPLLVAVRLAETM